MPSMVPIDLSPIEIPQPTQLQEIRTSRMRQFGPVLSGIDKKLQSGQLHVKKLGLPDDEHDLTFHGGIDKAIHQHCSKNYSFWRDLYPDEPIRSRFVPGGFGENLVADGFDETTVCIGDLVRIGPPNSSGTGGADGCVLEVSLPRQPCFKLNQRFGIKNFAPKTYQNSKTGWYYRVKEEGIIEAGMEMRVIRRDHPKWSISRLHHYVHRDKKDMDVTRELKEIKVMGDECRDVFEKRWEKDLEKARERAGGRSFRVAVKEMETPRIVRLELEAIERSDDVAGIPFGSYAVVKLPNGLKRSYSIVGGDTDHITLGVARDDNSRGGSVYIHDKLEAGSSISVLKIDRSIQPSGMASYYIFVVGGVGITAFLAMMSTVMAINQAFELHYAVRTDEEAAFKPLLCKLGSSVRIYDKSKGERMDIDKILRNRIWNSQVFTCGPSRMIDAVTEAAAAAGMAEDEVHCEAFSADTSGAPFTADVNVTGQDKKTRLNVGSDNTLLETLREVGLDVGSSCETGKCGTCRITVRCGKVDHRGTGLTKEEQQSEMLSCVSRGIGHIEIEIPEF